MPFLFDQVKPCAELRKELPVCNYLREAPGVVDPNGNKWNVIEYGMTPLTGDLKTRFFDMLDTLIFPCDVWKKK